MAEFICLAAGIAIGWWGHYHKAKVKRIGDTISSEFRKPPTLP